MTNCLEEIDGFVNKYRLLARAKEIATDSSRSKEKLLKENAELIEAYEALLETCDKPTRDYTQPVQPEEIMVMKNRLLTHVTHEFLTPLNLIMTPLEHMLSKSSSREDKKTLALMHRNSQRLLLIISQILELLKLESKKLQLKASEQDLVPFLKGIIASFELLAEQKEVDLIFDSDKESIILYFEPEKIAEVMCNLIMNALKFTPPGGRIRVSVRHLTENVVEISEHNTGTEISLDQTTRIFDRFYQLNERFEHYINGLGIGLFLAREYIKLHHGNIHVNIIKKTTDGQWKMSVPEASKEIYRASISMGGFITGEHGIGLIRKQYLSLGIDPHQIEVMKGIKKEFDPNNILNPGKIFD